jgi:hypothetical protein
VDGKIVQRRLFHPKGLLQEIVEFMGGEEVRRRVYDEQGRLEQQSERQPDGVRRVRAYYPSEAVRWELLEGPESTWSKTHYYESGELLGRHERREDGTDWLQELYPDGTLRAEGAVGHGTWKVYDEEGKLRGEADLSRLESPPEERVFEAAEALLLWEGLPEPPELEGMRRIPWSELEPFYGDPRNVPFLLKGLASGEQAIVEMACEELANQTLDRGRISDVAGPVAPFLVRLVEQGPPRLQMKLMELLAGMASQEGSLDRAHENRRLDSHDQIFTAITERLELWARLVVESLPPVQRWASRMLPLCLGEAAQKRVLSAIRERPEQHLRADWVLGLELMRPLSEGALQTLGELLEQQDDPMLRLCAALTLARVQDRTEHEVTSVLEEALQGRAAGSLASYGELYWSSSLSEDVSAALARLGICRR